MKNRFFALLALFITLPLLAAVPETEQPKSLEEELSALGTPGNEAPAGVTGEKLYAVQNRFVSLRRRVEIGLGAGNNFSADSFQVSRNLDASLRFYLSDRWFLGLSGSYVFNQFTSGGEFVINEANRVPDVAVTKYRADLQLGYNLFYGKFRLSMDSVFYFDQYVAVGPGLVGLITGDRWSAALDAGFAFWFGKNVSLRVGVKDHIFNEQRLLSSGLTNNFIGYFQAGYVFGG
jgi:outer membrane beta-barrel protein